MGPLVLDAASTVSIPVVGVIFAAVMLYLATKSARPYSSVQGDAYSAVVTQLNLANAELDRQIRRIEKLESEVEGCRHENIEKDREMNRLWRELDDLGSKLRHGP